MVFSIALLSQDPLYNKSIGVQANVFLDQNLYTGALIQPVWALRYSNNLNKNFSYGPEFSGIKTFYRIDNVRDTRLVHLNMGGFFRYTVLPDKRISPFAELSLYYQYIHFVPGSDQVYNNTSEQKTHSFTGYIAPGLSIKSKSRKVSLDLMYKFSPDPFVNSRHSVISYRINYLF